MVVAPPLPPLPLSSRFAAPPPQPRLHESPELETVIQHDTDELLNELRALPWQTAVRRLDEMVKRVRLLRVHAFLLDSIRADFPFFFRESKKAEIIENLPSRFRKACPRARVRSGPSRGVKLARALFSLRSCDRTRSRRATSRTSSASARRSRSATSPR